MAAHPSADAGRLDRAERPPDSHLSEPLLTPAAVAELLGIPRSSVYEYARNGAIPHLKIGRHVRFLRSDLEAWIETRRDAGRAW